MVEFISWAIFAESITKCEPKIAQNPCLHYCLKFTWLGLETPFCSVNGITDHAELKTHEVTLN